MISVKIMFAGELSLEFRSGEICPIPNGIWDDVVSSRRQISVFIPHGGVAAPIMHV